jgi:hypothetical protein
MQVLLYRDCSETEKEGLNLMLEKMIDKADM